MECVSSYDLSSQLNRPDSHPNLRHNEIRDELSVEKLTTSHLNQEPIIPTIAADWQY